MKKVLIAACAVALIGGASAASAQTTGPAPHTSMQAGDAMNANARMMHRGHRMTMRKRMMHHRMMKHRMGM